MIVTLKIPWKQIFNDLKVPSVLVSVYMMAIYLLDVYFTLQWVHVPPTIISIPGTVIALLLAFRTNSAYQRWWEARIIWGAIVNDSRTFVRQLKTFLPTNEKTTQLTGQMALRQIAWNYALSRNLRGQKTTQGLEKMLDHTELEAVTQKNNVPLALLFLQGQAIKYAFKAQWINAYQITELDRTLTRLTDSMGKCERIKSTVFPSSYSYMIDILIYLFILFLPFGLVDMIGIIIIPTTLSIAFAFLTIERIAIYMQDPFENRMNDTPMTAISTTIEINIREELNLGDVPKPVQPVKGVLM